LSPEAEYKRLTLELPRNLANAFVLAEKEMTFLPKLASKIIAGLMSIAAVIGTLMVFKGNPGSNARKVVECP